MIAALKALGKGKEADKTDKARGFGVLTDAGGVRSPSGSFGNGKEMGPTCRNLRLASETVD